MRAVGSPDHSITVAEISGKALRFGGRYEPIEGHGGSAQTRGAPSVAAHLAHVRVDEETGEVTLLAHVIAQDVGRALNPALVEGQMRGGATQGIGWALFEELVHDESGQLLTSSFLDYAIPLADRVPDIDTLIVEVPAPDGPFGAKGIGEAPVIAAAPAIANAVAAAVGIRLRELPMTAPRIWAALGSQEAAGVTLLERAAVDRRDVRDGASLRAPSGRVPLRRPYAPRGRHRRDARSLRGALDTARAIRVRRGIRLLPGRAGSRTWFLRTQRPHPRPRRTLAGHAHPVRPPRPHGQPDRRGTACARSRSAAESSSIHGRRRSRSTTSASARCSSSPSSEESRSSSTEAGACRRSPKTWRRSSAATTVSG